MERIHKKNGVTEQLNQSLKLKTQQFMLGRFGLVTQNGVFRFQDWFGVWIKKSTARYIFWWVCPWTAGGGGGLGECTMNRLVRLLFFPLLGPSYICEFVFAEVPHWVTQLVRTS